MISCSWLTGLLLDIVVLTTNIGILGCLSTVLAVLSSQDLSKSDLATFDSYLSRLEQSLV